MIRDTQRCKPLREKSRTKFPGLRKLSVMELGLEIQKASHSSVSPTRPPRKTSVLIDQVTDARATMALYRLHKTAWEQSIRPTTEAYKAKLNKGKGKEESASGAGGKRKRDDDSGDEDQEAETASSGKNGKKRREEFPGGGRRGVSSGLSVVIRRGGKRIDGPRQRGVPRQSAPAASSGGSWWEEV